MTNNSKLDAENRPIEEVMGETELGTLIMKYRAMIIGAVIFAFVFLSGLGIYSHLSSKEQEQNAKLVYSFQQDYFDKMIQKTVTEEDFVINFLKVNEETKSFKSLVPIAIMASDYLVASGKNLEAKKILMTMVKTHNTDPAAFFLNTRLAVVHEDLGEITEAIAILKTIVGSKNTFLQAKNYTDLGRLYLKTNDKDNAKKSFEYVVENFKASEFLRVAKVYLSEM